MHSAFDHVVRVSPVLPLCCVSHLTDMQRVFRGYIGRVIAKFRRMERDNKYVP